MSQATDYLEAKLLDHVLGGTSYAQPASVWVSLHSAAPTDASPSNGEITAGGYTYARQQASWSAASSPGGTKTTSADLSWTNMPAVTVSHVAIFDTSTAGNGLFWGSLTANKTTNAGDTFRITSGNLTVTLA